MLPTADVVLIVGSRNSSNSTRLQEVAQVAGRPAYLIDNAGEIDPAWFAGTRDRSRHGRRQRAEELVTACVERLQALFGATIERRSIREEYVEFPLPLEVR